MTEAVIAAAFNLRRNKRMVAIRSFGAGPAERSPRVNHIKTAIR
jgi:hypothetical protein